MVLSHDENNDVSFFPLMAGCWEIEWEKVGRGGWKGKENGVVPKDTLGLWEVCIASVFLFTSKKTQVENNGSQVNPAGVLVPTLLFSG